MSLGYSMISMDTPVVSSGGSFRSNYRTLWDLDELITAAAGDDAEAAFSSTVRIGNRLWNFSDHMTGEEALLRALGRQLVLVMPQAGLHEAVENLIDAYQFHIEASHRQLPKVTSAPSRGLVKNVSTRPELMLE